MIRRGFWLPGLCKLPRLTGKSFGCGRNDGGDPRFWGKNGGGEFDRCGVALVFGLKMGVGGVEKCFKV